MTTQGPLGRSSPIVVLFCDIADIGRIVNEHGAEWAKVFPRYQELVWAAIEGAGGCVEDGESASFFGSFREPVGAVRAAGAIQRAMADLELPEGLEVQARVGVHAGVLGETISHSAHTRPQFEGLDVHRGARVRGAARPGQVLISGAVRDLLEDSNQLEDLGFHRLRDFPESVRLYNLVVFRDRNAEFFGPPDTLDYRPTNLTGDDRVLLGRDELIDQIKESFIRGNERLITLTGPGGVGKTRVAIQAGSDLLEDHRGGVWLVRAETLSSAEELLSAIAIALSVNDLPNKELIDSVSERVEGSEVLLVLDNLEQIGGSGTLIAELLDRTISLKILATSQVPFHIDHEKLVKIEPLKTGLALELFAVRAKEASRELDLKDTKTNRTATALVERLDRLPLAIELAAAQLRNIDLHQLAKSLDSPLELTTDQQGKPSRHKSLAAVIDWSIDALPPQAKTLFTRLGVFRGITTLELIEQVCGGGVELGEKGEESEASHSQLSERESFEAQVIDSDAGAIGLNGNRLASTSMSNINEGGVLEAAVTLVDFSILRRVEVGFGMPPAIQQAAQGLFGRSAEKGTLERLHALAMVKEAQRFKDVNSISLQTSNEGVALKANFNQAISWASRNDTRIWLDFVLTLMHWWVYVGEHSREMREITDVLKLDGISQVERAVLLTARAHMHSLFDEYDSARKDIDEALKLVGPSDSIERGNCYNVLSLVLFDLDATASADAARNAVAIFRELTHYERLLRALCLQAQALIRAHVIDQAASILDEATELAKTLNSIDGRAGVNNTKGDWALAAGQPLKALHFYASALAARWSLWLVGFDTAGIIVSLGRLGQYKHAVELFEGLNAGRQEMGLNNSNLNSDESAESDWSELLTNARHVLGPAEFKQAQLRGRKLQVGQIATRALEIAGRYRSPSADDSD